MKRLPGYVPRGRFIKEERVPFKELLPLKLKTSVSGKSESSGGASCVQEMSVLFACLKRNDFMENKCTKEVSSFHKCYNEHVAQQKTKKEQERKGVLKAGEKRLSHKQAGELLKKFPG